MTTNYTQAIKNKLNQRINPATQDTLAQIKTDTGNIITNTASIQTITANIQSNTSRIPNNGQTSKLNSAPVAIASNQPTLKVAGKMKFVPSNKALSMMDNDSLYYLRKIIKQLESLNTVDSARRKRVFVDGSVDMTLTGSAAMSTMVNQGVQMYQDIARNEYANGIRNKLIFK